MEESYIYNYTCQQKEDFVFWSGGNFPTQKSLGVSLEEVCLRFKALFLLSNKIIASSSFYYESEYTRVITGMFQEIFRSGYATYFIDENISDFTEHGLLKIKKSPTALSAYANEEQVRIYGKELDSLGVVLRRPAKSISDEMQYIWMEDVFSKAENSLGAFLERSIPLDSDRKALGRRIAGIAVNPPVDFVWEYVASSVNSFSPRLPLGFYSFARNRLSEIYAIACAKVLNLQLDLTLVDKISRYDARLFCKCMEHLKVLDALKELDQKQLIHLKQRDEFTWLRNQYFQLINAVNNSEQALKKNLDISLDIIETFKQLPHLSGVGTKSMINVLFKEYFRNNKTLKDYKQPVDILLSSYDAVINSTEKRDLLKWFKAPEYLFDKLSYPGLEKNYQIVDYENGGITKMGINALIVVAKQEEYDAVLNRLESGGAVILSEHPHSFSVQSKHGFNVNGVLIQSGQGNVNSAIATLLAVLKFSPDIVILTGILGGLSGAEDVRLGDIIVAEQHVNYEMAKVKQNIPIDRRFQVTRGSRSLLSAARDLPREDWIYNSFVERPPSDSQVSKVYFGVVLVGDKVVADIDLVTELKSSWSRAIGIEMESYGASMAIEHASKKTDFLAVKSISDFADKDKNDAWHDYCTDIAASYTIALIKSYDFPNHYTALTNTSEHPQHSGENKITGAVLVKLNERLEDSWRPVATYLEIPRMDQRRFETGREVYDIYEWLKQRNRVGDLWKAVLEVGRDDVVNELKQ